MRERCHSKKGRNFAHYGKNGIKVCRQWEVYKTFYDEMFVPYLDHIKVHGKNNTTIERINNKKGYDFVNCRWATMGEQVYNRDRPRSLNKSGLRGIYKLKDSFRAVLSFQGKKFHIAVFKNKLLAIKAYNKKAKELYGRYAILNKI
jgi:hypothetical protein